MKLNKLLTINLLFFSGLVISNECLAVTGNATPTEYSVNVENVEFHQVGAPANAFVAYNAGSANFNIASVAANAQVGSLLNTATPPSGNYDQFRVTVSNVFTITAASNGNLSNGKPCRTVTGGAAVTNPLGDGSISVAYLGATDGGMPEPETVTVPTGSAVVYPAGIVAVGNSIQATFPSSFTITNKVPQATVKFNVTDAVLLEALGETQCIVLPMPPSVDVTIA